MADCHHNSVNGNNIYSTLEMQKAWHLFGILLDIGRPTSPNELAARCELFITTPDFVRYLCTIPNSPICLVDNGFVLISMVAISAMGRYVSKAMNGWDILRRDFGDLDPNRLWGSDVKTYFRKRKRLVLDAGVSFSAKRLLTSTPGNVAGDESCLSMARRIPHSLTEVPAEYVTITNSNSLTVDISVGEVKMVHSDLKKDEVPLCLNYADFPSLLINDAGQKRANDDVLMNKSMNNDDIGSASETRRGFHTFEVEKVSSMPNPSHTDKGVSCNLDLCLGPPCTTAYSLVYDEVLVKDNILTNKLENKSSLCLDDGMQPYVRPLEIDNGIYDNHSFDILGWKLEDEKNKMCEIKNSTEYTRTRANYLVHSEKHAVTSEAERSFLDLRSLVNTSNLDRDEICRKEDTQIPHLSPNQSCNQKQVAKTFGKLIGAPNSPEEVPLESAVNKEVFDSLKKQNRHNTVNKLVPKVRKFKKSSNENMHIKKDPLDTTTVSPNLEKTTLPQFESFIIEEEEGSGGYGIVYRARRKDDGKRFAIKCPHVNAHQHNVNNERKMLERFGGKNFIIKYEGSFRSGSSECFILEHVEHDRPEVLKKEIDLVQLQWYGYCLFRALACLHKQGVIHRDVKPGNFLFSRKQNKGYLIDFNLAMDLHQKYSIASKSNSGHHASLDHVPVPCSVSGSANKDKKNFRGNFVAHKEATGKSKHTYEFDQNMKKRFYAGSSNNYHERGGGNTVRSQGADGSGITSTKDISARTLSTENMREPLPCQGRKELISLVQNALLSTDHVTPNSAVLQRKRVAAPPGKAESKIVYPSPMLVHCPGVSVAGSRVLKNKGDAKRKREGSCAGTKGFRAPEVLFRSLHQGPQVDVWSAGVTLLYLILGKCAFTGDPEQNIKDIAKLRGSEDLWEVAKLHDRESAFPGELWNIQSFPAMDLQSWCKVHTKRTEFFKLIPRSLFDLVGKCLTVNPRLRISAEEALKHEFFNSCHESLRKQRLLRRGSGSNSFNVHSEAVRAQLSLI